MDAEKNNAAVAAAFSAGSCNQHQRPDFPDQPSACTSEPNRGGALLLRTAGGQACCNNAGALAVLLLFLGYSLVTAHRVRDRPGDLAFVAFSYADLAALVLCLRRVERLPPAPCPAGEEERRRFQLAVWALCSVLSCAFAYRVSLIMPLALVIVIWSMTSFVVLVGFFLLVVCKDRGYHAMADDGDRDAGEGKSLAKKIGDGDEFV